MLSFYSLDNKRLQVEHPPQPPKTQTFQKSDPGQQQTPQSELLNKNDTSEKLAVTPQDHANRLQKYLMMYTGQGTYGLPQQWERTANHNAVVLRHLLDHFRDVKSIFPGAPIPSTCTISSKLRKTIETALKQIAEDLDEFNTKVLCFGFFFFLKILFLFILVAQYNPTCFSFGEFYYERCSSALGSFC